MDPIKPISIRSPGGYVTSSPSSTSASPTGQELAAINSAASSSSYSSVSSAVASQVLPVTIRALVIDDNSTNRTLLSMHIKKAVISLIKNNRGIKSNTNKSLPPVDKLNIVVETATHGREAIRKHQTEAFDVIFIDNTMEPPESSPNAFRDADLSGFETARILRNLSPEAFLVSFSTDVWNDHHFGLLSFLDPLFQTRGNKPLSGTAIHYPDENASTVKPISSEDVKRVLSQVPLIKKTLGIKPASTPMATLPAARDLGNRSQSSIDFTHHQSSHDARPSPTTLMNIEELKQTQLPTYQEPAATPDEEVSSQLSSVSPAHADNSSYMDSRSSHESFISTVSSVSQGQIRSFGTQRTARQGIISPTTQRAKSDSPVAVSPKADSISPGQLVHSTSSSFRGSPTLMGSSSALFQSVRVKPEKDLEVKATPTSGRASPQ